MTGLEYLVSPIIGVLALAFVAQENEPPARAEVLPQASGEPEILVTDIPVEEISASETALEVLPLPVFQGLTDEQVFDKAVVYMQDLETLQADFTQTAPDGQVSYGKVDLARPSRLRFDYAPPSAQLIVAAQGLVYVEDKDLETVDSYPVSKTPLKFLLSKQVKSEDVVLDAIERTPNSVAVSLMSSDDDMEGQLVLVFEAPELALRRWAVIDGRGGITMIDLDNIVIGEKIAASTFKVPVRCGKFQKNCD